MAENAEHEEIAKHKETYIQCDEHNTISTNRCYVTMYRESRPLALFATRSFVMICNDGGASCWSGNGSQPLRKKGNAHHRYGK